MMKKMKGFTLAEVLTTLMVIGVVAALTVPTLINSTGEAQYKATYKKALAALENGIGQLKANQTSCVVQDSAGLAKCFTNVIQGTLLNEEGKSTGDKNVILTPDGVAYRFVYSGVRDAAKGRAIDSFCPALTNSDYSQKEIHNGYDAKCAVMVDLDGFNKGTVQFNQHYNDEGFDTDMSGFVEGVSLDTKEGDQQFIIIGSDGAYPYRHRDAGAVSIKNTGFSWMYGENMELNTERN